jgi:hypothetical protein
MKGNRWTQNIKCVERGIMHISLWLETPMGKSDLENKPVYSYGGNNISWVMKRLVPDNAD